MINIVGLVGLLLLSSLGSSVMLLSSPFDPISVENHPAEMMKSTEKLSSKEQEKAVDDHLIVAQEKAAAASEVFDEVSRLLEDVTAGKLAAASDSIQSKPEENFQKTGTQKKKKRSKDLGFRRDLFIFFFFFLGISSENFEFSMIWQTNTQSLSRSMTGVFVFFGGAKDFFLSVLFSCCCYREVHPGDH